MIPPRPKNAAATREAMLAAARRRFLQESYDNVGLREIASDVGVDVSLIGRYFGSKEQLFRAVLRHGKVDPFRNDIAAAELPSYLASLAVPDSPGSESQHIERLQIILRSASSPKASTIVREAFHEDVMVPVADLLKGEDACTRASLAISVLTGTTILRAIMGVDSLCDCDREAVRADIARLLELALFGNLTDRSALSGDTISG